MKKACIYLFVFASSAAFPTGAVALSPVCARNFGTGLLNAVADRQIDDVSKMLTQPMPNEDRQTTLADALMLTLSGQSTSCAKTYHSVELFRILIQSGANVNAHVRVNTSKTTFLMRAAQDGDAEMASAALAAGAKVNETTSGSTALIEAIRSRQPKMVAFLLNSGADPNLEVGERGSYRATALFAAARSPGPANTVLKLLIQHGLQNGAHGTSAIDEFAAYYQGADEDSQECLKLLLILQGNFRARGDLTPALVSSIHHSYSGISVIEALLSRGATADWRAVLALANRSDGRSWKVSRARVFELLLRYGLDPDQTTPGGKHWLEVLTPTEPLAKRWFLEELTAVLGREP